MLESHAAAPRRSVASGSLPESAGRSRAGAIPVAAFVVAVAFAAIAGNAAVAEDAPAAPGAGSGGATLVLRDGRALAGEVLAETADAVTFRSGGSTRMYAKSDIERIDRSPGGADRAAGSGPAVPGPSGTPSAPTAPGAPPSAAPAEPPAAAPSKNAFGKKGKTLSDAARTWIRDLAAKAETEDEQVRRSIAAALRAFGPVAGPAIRDAAANAATPSARSFLEAVANDLKGDRGGDGSKPRRGEPGAPAPAPAQPPAGTNETAPPAAPPEASPKTEPMQPEPAAPGGGAGNAGRPGRAARDRLVADLELRDDQRPKMEQVMGALERGQLGMLRELRQGAIAPDQVAPRIETLRASTLAAAKEFLDATQFDLFEEQAQRYFDGLVLRASRGEARPGGQPKPGDERKPGDEPAPTPKTGE